LRHGDTDAYGLSFANPDGYGDRDAYRHARVHAGRVAAEGEHAY
jgi:hypothetical protein